MSKKLNYAAAQVHTPQNLKAREDQVENSAGGFVWQIDKWQQLRRFLSIGCEGGTYYVKEADLTKRNILSVEACIKEDFNRVISTIVEISDSGIAHKNEPALFALASCCAVKDVNKRVTSEILNKVVRTGTHLLTFVDYINTLRGWGQGMMALVRSWYTSKNLEKLAYQVVKYQDRNGWSHRDVLRTIHLTPPNDLYSTLFKWITNRDAFLDEEKHPIKTTIQTVDAFMQAHYGDVSEKQLINLIHDFHLTHEMIPTQFKKSKQVWDILVQEMPLTALIRNLAPITNVGLLTASNFDLIDLINKKLSDQNYLKQSRIHPISILFALKTYSSGHGVKGSLTWTPVQKVIDILNEAFYLSFSVVEPTHKKLHLGVDISGSMSYTTIANSFVSCAEVAAALSLVTAKVEPKCAIFGFSHKYTPLPISPNLRMDAVLSRMKKLAFGGTDCALPMIYAKRNKEYYDTFIIYTDSETWCGKIHPFEALKDYRRAINPEAKLVVVAFTSLGFTIADPTDSGSLDVIGFSPDVPPIINQFITGAI